MAGASGPQQAPSAGCTTLHAMPACCWPPCARAPAAAGAAAASMHFSVCRRPLCLQDPRFPAAACNPSFHLGLAIHTPRLSMPCMGGLPARAAVWPILRALTPLLNRVPRGLPARAESHAALSRCAPGGARGLRAATVPSQHCCELAAGLQMHAMGSACRRVADPCVLASAAAARPPMALSAQSCGNARHRFEGQHPQRCTGGRCAWASFGTAPDCRSARSTPHPRSEVGRPPVLRAPAKWWVDVSN